MTSVIKLLSDFSSNNRDNNDLSNKIILFKFQSYSTIFISQLFNYLKSNSSNSIVLLEVKDLKLSELHVKLHRNFLGQQVCYFIKDLYSIENTKKQAIYDYLVSYSGDNLIFIFDQPSTFENSSKNPLICFPTFDVPNNLNIDIYNKYYKIFYQNCNINSFFIRKLFKSYQTIPLDLALNIMMYQSNLSSKSNYFFDNWLTKIVPQEKSLFDLSHYLFEKRVKGFFELWLKYKFDYPIEFWLSFWSDQIWQATIIVTIANKYGILKAKKYSSRLPFSFINKNYTSYNISYLTKAHQCLYNIDFNIKNDTGYNALELWFSKFLFNKF